MVYIPDEMEMQGDFSDIPLLLDPKLLRMARRIYRSYCFLHPRSSRQPLGIAIHKETHRGQLMFNNKPILLPGECFVPVKQLETEVR
ncbi:MAG: hypothetical protein VKL42_09855 [Snowella sp.]|nr:hypothetical protein [Snowella sp.]